MEIQRKLRAKQQTIISGMSYFASHVSEASTSAGTRRKVNQSCCAQPVAQTRIRLALKACFIQRKMLISCLASKMVLCQVRKFI